MASSKSKWLAYTVIVGLIPLLTRLLAWTVTAPGMVGPLMASDFITLGLVLHISIVNEVEHATLRAADLKTISNGTSLLFITSYGALYAIAIIGERNPRFVDTSLMLSISVGLAATSFLLGLKVYQRLSHRNSK
ncbi:hypothetical protein [Duganella hordei]|uniref:hypothetical protein n=1 Tax=Duganella hordei TaxID=2865934 RepID=UPI003341544E